MKNLLVTTCIISTILFNSCQKEKTNDPNYIKVGVESGPEFVIAQAAQKEAKEKYGLEVELVEFNDYVLPNTALNDGDIDVNAIQHKPFLDDQIEKRGYKLAIVGNTFIYPLAGYSKKIKSVQELQDGSTIAIPNDATNRGRALLLLQKEGLIILKNTNTLVPSITDITGNPKKLKIVELEAPQLPQVLDDKEVTVAIINNTFATKEGLTLQDGIFVEDVDSPYMNIIVAREDNKNAENVKKFVQAYQSDKVAQTADREFKGGAIKGW
jgi:D-methionine transport system substrate-binding protein